MINPRQPYDCAEAFRRLDDFLDRELTPEEMGLVQAHLEVCETCAREFAFESKALRTLRDKVCRIDLPEDLLGRVQISLNQVQIDIGMNSPEKE